MISETAGRLIQLVLMIGALLMCSHAFSQEPAYTIERLSLFVHDSAGVWEDMRIGETTSNLPPAMSVEFIPQGNPQASLVWIWVLTNASTSDLQDLRVTALIDVDFNAEANTFFNETGARIALSAPEGHIPPDRWEISEPGYHHGNLLQRAPFGVLGLLWFSVLWSWLSAFHNTAFCFE